MQLHIFYYLVKANYMKENININQKGGKRFYPSISDFTVPDFISFDFDPLGSYTGMSETGTPQQDADDL